MTTVGRFRVSENAGRTSYLRHEDENYFFISSFFIIESFFILSFFILSFDIFSSFIFSWTSCTPEGALCGAGVKAFARAVEARRAVSAKSAERFMLIPCSRKPVAKTISPGGKTLRELRAPAGHKLRTVNDSSVRKP
jgi:hypothetical protein